MYLLGIPTGKYTQGCFVSSFVVDPDLLCGYRFSTGSGPGPTCDTHRSTCAHPWSRLIKTDEWPVLTSSDQSKTNQNLPSTININVSCSYLLFSLIKHWPNNLLIKINAIWFKIFGKKPGKPLSYMIVLLCTRKTSQDQSWLVFFWS